MHKAIDLEYSNHPLQILSSFQRDFLPGTIYIKVLSQKQVLESCNGLIDIFISCGINLVPIEEMVSQLQIRKQDQTMKPGRWVRIKCGKYQGNLAQVIDITENSEEVGLKFIPHINLSLKDNIAATVGGKKCKKVGIAVSMGMCPPPHFFNYEEVVKVYKRKMVLKWNQVYMFQNNTYKDGFIKKDFWLSVLQLNNVQ